MARVVVVGGGVMGLSAGHYAAAAGHSVCVVEADRRAGGMAAHFDFEGISIERFYHFVCKSDTSTFELLKELGIANLLRWKVTSMGLYTSDRLYSWGNPIALLTFPEISLLGRLRYALMAFVATKRDRWPALETRSAKDWIVQWCGREVYDKLWEPLFRLKFYEYADSISAAWIWTRIKRIGRSRKSLFHEELGYIEGGSERLVEALSSSIEQRGGAVKLGTPATQVIIESNRVVGVRTADALIEADAVISTVPTPLVAGLIPDLPISLLKKYSEIKNIGVCCVTFKLAKPVSPHFWINISGPDMPIPGIVEFSNLRPVPATIVYVPYYMPITNPKFSWPDEQLTNEAFRCLQALNPQLSRSDLIAARVGRLRYAQPVCEPGFAAKLPPIQTPVRGLQIADTCFYYPEDRGISESIRLGREMAGRINR